MHHGTLVPEEEYQFGFLSLTSTLYFQIGQQLRAGKLVNSRIAQSLERYHGLGWLRERWDKLKKI